MPFVRLLIAACIVLIAAWAPPARSDAATQALPETMDMLRHAIAAQTVEGKNQVPAFAQYLAGKLESAGFAQSDIEIIPVEHTAALVVHYRGSDKSLRPILLSAHMDVVAANPADWQRDPFKLIEENGYLYGRGVADMKTNMIALVETFMRFKREHCVPKRSMIMVFSGDEETDMASTRELAKRYHDAEFLLNADAGGGTLNAQGKPVVYEIQAAEKTYADFKLTVTSAGGHSSEPDVPKNAIYRLAKALDRIAAYQFPVQHSEITLASLKATGEHNTGPIAAAMRAFAANPNDAKAAATLSADPAYVGQIRTTCVATMLDGGHALNALPQRTDANINCRIFPGTHIASVQATLAKVIDDPSVKITVRQPPPVESPASPLRKDVVDAVSAVVHQRYPGLDIVPGMSAGASDSMYFRNAGVPSYGVDPSFSKPNDTFAHGLNEKLLASNVPWALEFWDKLLTKLSQ
ncbi:MAG: N-acetylornithine deacetylase [Rhodanobacteraceae bacterium]|jgi:acetylornithine deacetylase/succinyl-diaminopimelate desuccinylase-like protein|nr:MAG: N-acetylornithine deacetylase [Rhodanobacteraceae bacterium]